MQDVGPEYFLDLLAQYGSPMCLLFDLYSVCSYSQNLSSEINRSLKVQIEGFLIHFIESERRLICQCRSSQYYLHLIQGKDCYKIYGCLPVILICVS